MLSILLLPQTILILAAIIPAIFLLIKVYKSDKLEKEDPRFILLLLISGIISTLIASFLEEIGSFLLSISFSSPTLLYNIILYYIVVALSEEGSKYLLLRKKTWNNENFNCKYDAVVYAVAVSLGFALWENILYVFRYGLSVALTRAITAIPGHCSFGVFMGLWYGEEREHTVYGERARATMSRILTLVFPTLLHGTYDFLCTYAEDWKGTITFVVFTILLFFFSFFMVKKKSSEDHYL